MSGEPEGAEAAGWWAAVGFGPCALGSSRRPTRDWREARAAWDEACAADRTGDTRKNSKVCAFSTRALARGGSVDAEMKRAGEVRVLESWVAPWAGGGVRVSRL